MRPNEPPAGVAVAYRQQYRRCGKPDCPACRPDAPGHGPYWYARWQEGGRTRSHYLGTRLPPDIADAVGASPLSARIAPASPAPADHPGSVTGSAGVSSVPVVAPPTRGDGRDARRAPAAAPIHETGVGSAPNEARGGPLAVPALRVRTLGAFQVWRGDEPIAPERWSRRIVATLFKCLVTVPGHRLSRERAIDLLWPEAAADPDRAAANLRATVYRLRAVLDAPGAATSYLRSDGQMLVLDPRPADEVTDRDAGQSHAAPATAQAWLDADAFARGGHGAGRARPRAGVCRPGSLRRRVPARRPLRGVGGGAAGRAAGALPCPAAAPGPPRRRGRRHGERRALPAPPAGGRPLPRARPRLLMRLLAADGARAEALRAYEALARALRDDLDVVPTPETEAARAALLAAEAPVAPPLPARPALAATNLPAALTGFVGRGRELAALGHALARGPAECRLLTLAGIGGCGKTRLALRVAADNGAGYPDGVWLVELAALADPALVAGAVAAVLGLRETPGEPVLTTLADALRPRRLLLVLDNCEHLVAACAEVATTLLRACPRLQILATSREALGMAGEVVWRVPSLSLPPVTDALRATVAPPSPPRPDVAGGGEGAGGEQDGALRLDRLERFEAVQLFLARARAARPDFGLSARNAFAVVDVCRRLDGLPLAIELAAARLGALSVQEVAARLDDRFRLLKAGNRAAPPRHQTLRGVLDWSYALLSPPEQALLRRLAVFAGGWTLAAAEAVCAGGIVGADDVLDLLAGLEAKSLVVLADGPAGDPAGDPASGNGESRYSFLETVRQYADDHLTASGERETIADAHAAYMAEVAERAAAGLFGPAQRAWLDRLEAEHDNVRAALAWGTRVDVDAPSADAVRLAGSLGWFWMLHGHLGEGRRWLARVLARGCGHTDDAGVTALPGRDPLMAVAAWPPPGSTCLRATGKAAGNGGPDCAARARALNAAGMLAERQQEYAVAVNLLEESLTLFRALGDTQGSADALNGLGHVAWGRGDHPRALALYCENLALRQAMGDRRGIANALNNLARVYKYQGNAAEAIVFYERSLALWKELGEPWGLANVLSNLGIEMYEQGDYARALALHRESLRVRRELGDKLGISWSLTNVATVSVRLGRHERATVLFEESLALARQLGDRANITDIVEGLAEVALARADMARAAHLFAAVAVMRAATGDPLSPVERARYDRNVAAARAALGDDAFVAAREAGQAMTAEDTVAYALAGG